MINPIVPQKRNLMPYYSNSVPEGVWIDPSTGETFVSTRAMSRLLDMDTTAIESETEHMDVEAYGVELFEVDNEETIRCVRLHSTDTFISIMGEYRLDLFSSVGYRGLLSILYTMVGFAGIPPYLSNSPNTQTLEDTVEFLNENNSAYNYVFKLVAPYLYKQYDGKQKR